MNPVNLKDRIARLPSLDEYGNPENLDHAKELIAIMRIVMSQFAARSLRASCDCCTCNARRLLNAIEIPHTEEKS